MYAERRRSRRITDSVNEMDVRRYGRRRGTIAEVDSGQAGSAAGDGCDCGCGSVVDAWRREGAKVGAV